MAKLTKVEDYGKVLGEAHREQQEAREFALLDITHRVAGVEINALTLPSYMELCATGNPLVCGGTVTMIDAIRFLWRLSPCFTRQRSLFAWWVRRGIINAVCKHRHTVICECHDFVDKMLLDAPPSGASSSGPVASFAASVISLLARHHSWAKHDILKLPLPEVFQYINLIRREINPKAPTFNRRVDQVNAELLELLNKNGGQN